MLLFYVLLGAAATVATALCSCFNGLEWLWTLPMLIGYSIGLIILHFLILFIISLFVDKTKEQTTDNRFFRFVTVYSMGMVLTLFNVHITVEGLDKVPNGRWLLISNHRSAFDPFIQMWVLRKHDLAFISKPENLRIPIAGAFMHKCCFLCIDRENPRNALRTILGAVKLIKNDVVSFGIYPEGTRNRDKGLLPFKNGALQIAQKANIPIISSVLYNTEAVTKNAFLPWKRTNVVFKILSVVDAQSATSEKSVDLGDKLHAEIENAWYELDKK